MIISGKTTRRGFWHGSINLLEKGRMSRNPKLSAGKGDVQLYQLQHSLFYISCLVFFRCSSLFVMPNFGVVFQLRGIKQRVSLVVFN